MPKTLPFRISAFRRERRAKHGDSFGARIVQGVLDGTESTVDGLLARVAQDHPNQRGTSPMVSFDRFQKRLKMHHCDI